MRSPPAGQSSHEAAEETGCQLSGWTDARKAASHPKPLAPVQAPRRQRHSAHISRTHRGIFAAPRILPQNHAHTPGSQRDMRASFSAVRPERASRFKSDLVTPQPTHLTKAVSSKWPRSPTRQSPPLAPQNSPPIVPASPPLGGHRMGQRPRPETPTPPLSLCSRVTPAGSVTPTPAHFPRPLLVAPVKLPWVLHRYCWSPLPVWPSPRKTTSPGRGSVCLLHSQTLVPETVPSGRGRCPKPDGGHSRSPPSRLDRPPPAGTRTDAARVIQGAGQHARPQPQRPAPPHPALPHMSSQPELA